MHDGMLPGALDLDLDIASLQFELGNVLLDEEFDEFFQLFLIHSFTVGSFAVPAARRKAAQTSRAARSCPADV
jgi:hypothetical protein